MSGRCLEGVLTLSGGYLWNSKMVCRVSRECLEGVWKDYQVREMSSQDSLSQDRSSQDRSRKDRSI